MPWPGTEEREDAHWEGAAQMNSELCPDHGGNFKSSVPSSLAGTAPTLRVVGNADLFHAELYTGT